MVLPRSDDCDSGLWATASTVRPALFSSIPAARTVQSIRSEMVLTAASGPSSFRQAGGQLFFELADLLLQEAAAQADPAAVQAHLQEARQMPLRYLNALSKSYNPIMGT